ncbi:hypothetical protein V6N11_044842 [Hibiscus sabdariffa]|uniref:Uncharacterized protein n=1 Tax=Hibiscus sabdariffa TaxID=183260 RepID=A0ABR2PU76_9ROSI
MATNVSSSSGPAYYTDVNLQNNSNVNLSFSSKNDWYGSEQSPQDIQANSSASFLSLADTQAGSSKAGVVYAVTGDIKWVVAWSNMDGQSNKVYMDITDTDVDWPTVESLLDKSWFDPAAVSKLGYTTRAMIHPDSPTPLLIAKLESSN